MTHINRLMYRLVPVAVLLSLSACVDREQDGLASQSEQVLEDEGTPEFLTCPQTVAPPETARAVIDSAGGTLASGRNELMIPAGAITGAGIEFIMQPESGERVGVSIEGNGSVRFQAGRSATLSVDFSRCEPNAIGEEPDQWSVWRMNPAGVQGRPLRTIMDMEERRAVTQIDSTSGFIIAH